MAWEQQPGIGISPELIALQDEANDETLREIIERPIRERTNRIAADRERYARRLLEDRMPRRLHWLIDHPRLLKRVLRVIKRWEPTLSVVPLRRPIPVAFSSEAASAEARYWEREMRIAGKRVSSGGLVFTYTNASGLPAEVYGG